MTTETKLKPNKGKMIPQKPFISALTKAEWINGAYLLNQSQGNISNNRSGTVTNTNVCIAQCDRGAEVITLSGYTSNSEHTCEQHVQTVLDNTKQYVAVKGYKRYFKLLLMTGQT